MVKRKAGAKVTYRTSRKLKKKVVSLRSRRLVNRVVAAVNALALVPRRRAKAGKITIKRIVKHMGAPAANPETVRTIRIEEGLEKVQHAPPRYPDIAAVVPSSSQRSGGRFCY